MTFETRPNWNWYKPVVLTDLPSPSRYRGLVSGDSRGGSTQFISGTTTSKASGATGARDEGDAS